MEVKEGQTRRPHVVISCLHEMLEWANPQRQKTKQTKKPPNYIVALGWGSGGGEVGRLWLRGYWVSFCDYENVLKLIVVMDTQP